MTGNKTHFILIQFLVFLTNYVKAGFILMAEAGKRYITPSGAELIVTKGGAGNLSDGETPLQIKDAGDGYDGVSSEGTDALSLGKRFQSKDGSVTVLVTKAGVCNLQYDGEPMEIQQPRKLPSSD